MREGWTYKKLGEVAKISSGKAIPSSDIIENYSEDLYPCYGGNGLRGYVDHYSHDGLIPVVGRVGALCGNVHLPQGKFYATEHALVVCLTTADEPHYMKYLLSFLNLRQYAKGVAQPVLSASTLSKISISLPSLSEQQSIVAELDKINELISLKKAQLSDLDSLAQSIFYDMFGDPIENEKGWEVKKLGEISTVKTGPFGSMLHKDDYISNGIPLVNPIHIKDYRIVADVNFTISSEKAKELNNYILRRNDVIFARRGDIGRCAVVSDVEDGYLCGTGSLFVRFEHKVIPQYIMYIIRSSSFIKELISKAKGATMLNLNSTIIADLQIPLPPLSLQQDFAKRVELIEQQKAQISSTIKDLETLLASRMQYWFD